MLLGPRTRTVRDRLLHSVPQPRKSGVGVSTGAVLTDASTPEDIEELLGIRPKAVGTLERVVELRTTELASSHMDAALRAAQQEGYNQLAVGVARYMWHVGALKGGCSGCCLCVGAVHRGLLKVGGGGDAVSGGDERQFGSQQLTSYPS